MFEISEDAMDLMLTRLDDALEGRPELRRSSARTGLRLNVNQGNAYLSLAFPRPTDEVMTYMGRTLLIIDRLDYSRLQDSCLTVLQGPNGRMLSMAPRDSTPVS